MANLGAFGIYTVYNWCTENTAYENARYWDTWGGGGEEYILHTQTHTHTFYSIFKQIVIGITHLSASNFLHKNPAA